MKSLFEEFGGTYTLGKDGMYYPNLMIEETDQRSIGKWGRMHREYLKEQHPRLYQRLILTELWADILPMQTEERQRCLKA